MAQAADPSFAHIGAGFGCDTMWLDTEYNDFGADDGETPMSDPPPVRSFPGIALSDCTGDGLEDDRRPRFQPSLYSDSSMPSAPPSFVLSSAHDGRTNASRTDYADLAPVPQHAYNEDDGPQVPEVATMEALAPANISAADHWNHAGVTPATTGMQASSASAMAALAGTGRLVRSRPRDATEVVAYLPCEFARYKGCQETFPLHRSEGGMEAWQDHMVRAHMNNHMPRRSGCWFCDEKFRINEKDGPADGIVKFEVYKQRMRHIAQHYLERGGGAPEAATANPRPDPDFEAFLVNNGIWHPTTASAARVPKSTDPREPVQFSTQPRKVRSARADVQVFTERPGGRPRTVAHYL